MVLVLKSSELKRWLATEGAIFKPGKGSHLKVFLNGKQSILPMHAKDSELAHESQAGQRD